MTSTPVAPRAHELRFDDRVALVTGAGRGIGREHAKLLASRGAAVVVNDVGWAVDDTRPSSGPADEVVAEIRAAGGTAVPSYESVADDNGPPAIIETAINEFGRLDIVINNAGTILPGFFEEHTRDDFRKLFEVHVLGTFGVTQAAWPHLVAASYGRVITTTSGVIMGTTSGLIGYTTMKGAILTFTRALALEAADHGIHVNCFSPTAYSRMAPAMPSHLYSAEQLDALRETRGPELVAPVAAYLVHESCDLNGEVIYASGGTVGRFSLDLALGPARPDLVIEDVASEIAALTPAAP
jgi:NAD(P)-dependent dehydrogenase (short-subunit alcohol dehydrogenase family)